VAGRVRLGELVSRVRRDGARGVVSRVVHELDRRFAVDALDAIAPEDLVDPTTLTLPRPTHPPAPGTTPRIGWVCNAPAPGSGGHTTLFRMAAGIQELGFDSTLFLYDPRGGDLRRHEEVVRRSWPWLDVQVRDASAGIDGVDAAVASSWQSAHVLARYGTAPMARLYFVQDFEPFFYARGTHYALAEDSYRLGFRTIALGRMVHDVLADFGVASDLVPFGHDDRIYHRLDPERPRSGVVFYARRENDRRGYLMGKLALHELYRRHPEQQIHVYGDEVRDWDIPVISHGRLTPTELNELYNQVVAGLALSFTNITLVAEEMLAAGVVPVVNDSAYARADLDHPGAVWTQASPGALAAALSRVLTAAPRADLRAGSFDGTGVPWHVTRDAVVRVLRDELDVALVGDSASRATGEARRPGTVV
jgi:O-antigen biosynthesis protein